MIPLGLGLAGVVGFLVYKNFNPEYQATDILEANHDYILFKGIINAPNNLARVEQQLITNSMVLDPVLSDPDVCKAPSLRDPTSRDKKPPDQVNHRRCWYQAVAYGLLPRIQP